VFRLLVTANIVPSSPILVTLLMEAIRSSETVVLTKATRRNVPEDGILQTIYAFIIFLQFHNCNIKCYVFNGSGLEN
jgi:hypothetical protein